MTWGSKSAKPSVFIGSSSEAIRIAKQVCVELKDVAKTVLWKEVFPHGSATLEALMAEVKKHDFAVFILSADDLTKNLRNGPEQKTPRDNVVFELGLFMGGIGRANTFALVEKLKSSDLHLPTDLEGITYEPYDGKSTDSLATALRDPCHKISEAILRITAEKYPPRLQAPHLTPAGLAHGMDGGKVEFLTNTHVFHERLVEQLSEYRFDRFDVTYLVDHPPALTPDRPNTIKYFELVRGRISEGAKLRRIISFSREEKGFDDDPTKVNTCKAKAAWIFFNMIGTNGKAFRDGNLDLRYFNLESTGIRLLNFSLYYSETDNEEPVSWLHTNDRDQNQIFIRFYSKEIFDILHHIYEQWFDSCHPINTGNVIKLFNEIFPDRDVREVARVYRTRIGLKRKEDFDESVAFWEGLT